jgi:hypothetical protein
MRRARAESAEEMILRRRHTANFTTITNRLFDDERLAADELGILAFLLSRPDNWEVRRPALQRRFGIGPVAMRRIVRSWMKAGWCQAIKVRLPNGRFCILYDIYDLPGKELSEEEVVEALSLVSSEASSDDSSLDPQPEDQSETIESPPPGPPVVVHQGVVTDSWSYKEDITNTDQQIPENQNSERELARAREKHALNLAEFKRRYPTAASDDQTKIDDEWFKLEFDEAEPALSGIVPFLDKLKRDKRTTIPAAWKYLREKRWTLLDAAKPGQPATTVYPPGSLEAKAIAVLHDIAGRREAFWKIYRQADGSVRFSKPMTPQLLALGDPRVPPPDQWVSLDRNGGGSWEGLLAQFFGADVTQIRRNRMREGSRAPWPFAPSATGKIYDSKTGPPDGLMTAQDEADFK